MSARIWKTRRKKLSSWGCPAHFDNLRHADTPPKCWCGLRMVQR